MKTMKTFFSLILAITFVAGFSSCQEYRKYDNLEVIDDTYTGDISFQSIGSNPGGDFTGNGDSGNLSFVWDNTSKKAELRFDITTPTGSAQFILRDAKGKEVLNETRSAGGDDTFSGVSGEGKKGKWLVEIRLNDFDGDGSFSLTPVE